MNVISNGHLGSCCGVAVILGLCAVGCRHVEYEFIPVVFVGRPSAETPVEATHSTLEAIHRQRPFAEEREEFEACLHSAEQGDARAQMELGGRLRDGRGAERDVVEAGKWLNLAAKQNAPGAGGQLDALAREMTREQIAEALRRSSAFATNPPAVPP